MAETVYCMGCKGQREIKDSTVVTMTNGGRQLKAVCLGCGRKVSRFLPRETDGAA